MPESLVVLALRLSFAWARGSNHYPPTYVLIVRWRGVAPLVALFAREGRVPVVHTVLAGVPQAYFAPRAMELQNIEYKLHSLLLLV
eukprot:COSAG06_NODE_26952_length_604_cov_0.904950_1_plen_86_part_00